MEKLHLESYEVEIPHEEPSTVPMKYRGTISDHNDMAVLATKHLQRNFKFVTILGFASSMTCSWEAFFPLFVFGLINGGTGLVFWGFVAVGVALSLVYASLAELASMSPTAGGQYHWVSELASENWQKPLSYMVGWLTTIGWQTFLCGGAFINATMIQGLIAFNVDGYEWHNWHATCLTIGLILAGTFINTVFNAKLPLINTFFLVLHFTGFIALIVTLWVIGPQANPHILIEFSNEGGWPSTGLSAMVGLILPVSLFTGYDCSVHMSEEVQDASTRLPQAIMSSVVFNMLLTFVTAITVLFNAGNIENILDSTSRQPFIQMFYNNTQSYVATNIMTAIIIIMLGGSVINQIAATSRQLWSFARDDGIPGAKWVSKVTSRTSIPLNAIYVSITTSSLLSCINLGSSVALNAIISLGVVSLLTSYLVTLICLIWRRLNRRSHLEPLPLPHRAWSLGKFGLGINIAAAICVVPMEFFMFWPATTPVTAVDMNWSSAIFGGLVIFSAVFYFWKGRFVYRGPVVHVKRV